MSLNKHIRWLDCAKGFAIFIIILNHLTVEGFVERYLHLISIPCFVLIYGVHARPAQNWEDLKKLIFRRTYSLLLPYFLWAMIFDSHSVKNLLYICIGNHTNLLKAGSSGVLWYLPVFYLSVVVFEIILYLTKNSKIMLIISNVIVFAGAAVLFHLGIRELPWGIDIMMYMVPSITVGYLCGTFLLSEQSRRQTIIGIIIACLGLILCCGCELLHTDHPYVQIATADYGNIYLFFALSNIGVIAVFYLIKLADKIVALDRFNKYLANIGQQSLMIMFLHRDMVVYYPKILEKLNIQSNNLVAVVVAVIILLISYYASKVVVHFVPVLAGKRK